MKIYIAGPLFSKCEIKENKVLNEIIIGSGNQTYLPQEDGGCFAELPDNVDGVSKEKFIYLKDIEALEWCDTILFNFDGRVPDEGACFELGYAYAKGKRCIGYKTDVRSFMPSGDNLMLRMSVERILHSEEELKEFFSQNN